LPCPSVLLLHRSLSTSQPPFSPFSRRSENISERTSDEPFPFACAPHFSHLPYPFALFFFFTKLFLVCVVCYTSLCPVAALPSAGSDFFSQRFLHFYSGLVVVLRLLPLPLRHMISFLGSLFHTFLHPFMINSTLLARSCRHVPMQGVFYFARFSPAPLAVASSPPLFQAILICQEVNAFSLCPSSLTTGFSPFLLTFIRKPSVPSCLPSAAGISCLLWRLVQVFAPTPTHHLSPQSETAAPLSRPSARAFFAFPPPAFSILASDPFPPTFPLQWPSPEQI